MKELTIEQKAKAYDEALERTKSWVKGEYPECFTEAQKTAEFIFPELKESEDERMWKLIKKYVHYNISDIALNADHITREQLESWLEKQGTSYTKKDVDDAYLESISVAKNEMEKQYEADYQIRKDIATFIFNYRGVLKDRAKWMDYLGIKVSFVEKQGEKPQGKSALEAVKEEKVDNQNCVNPTDNPEPKFREGDFIVNDYCRGKIIALTSDAYLLDTGQGIPFSCEDSIHLWTTRDARDGDLIYVSTEEKGIQAIFHEYKNDIIFFHCYLCGDFVQGGYMPIGSVELVYPLQKTHYNRFFEKMHKAGYEWDAEKKKLKKIDDEEVNGEDYGIDGFWHAKRILEKTLGSVSGYQTDDGILDHKAAITAVKKLYEQKPTWTEEDGKKLSDILVILSGGENCFYNSPILINWLKSLKERMGG